jgi:hypothetical protein
VWEGVEWLRECTESYHLERHRNDTVDVYPLLQHAHCRPSQLIHHVVIQRQQVMGSVAAQSLHLRHSSLLIQPVQSITRFIPLSLSLFLSHSFSLTLSSLPHYV